MIKIHINSDLNCVMRLLTLLLFSIYLIPTQAQKLEFSQMSIAQANRLIELPLGCVETEYPNKLNQVIGTISDLKSPSDLHPIFYGCFDWHSAVHGYWSLVSLLQQFPNMRRADEARALLKKTLSSELVAQELRYFEADINKGFERTYGWAWLLKLAQALSEWKDPNDAQLGQNLASNLAPLTNHIVENYLTFLPKLVYPIRVGEHTNTAFGMAFAHDYAVALKDRKLQNIIEQRAMDFYFKDTRCPINWEPSGYDFLSPCLTEADLMRRVLNQKQFEKWLSRFMPSLKKSRYALEVGRVGDRTDGKLVHLDGLNFSRAWALYSLANSSPRYAHLRRIANQHMEYSYPNLIGDSYEGGHWLGSFAIYALNTANR